MHLAARDGDEATVKLLLKEDADVHSRDIVSQSLHSLRWPGLLVNLQGNKSGLNLLLLRNSFQAHDTPLHEASRNGNVECLQALLEARADINAENMVTTLYSSVLTIIIISCFN